MPGTTTGGSTAGCTTCCRCLSNAALHVAGLALGVANAARHRVRGYRTPRDFGSTDWERAVPYDRSVVDRWQRQSDMDVRGLRVLEVGPGPDLGTGAELLARGAASYLAVDLFPLAAQVPDEFYAAFGDIDVRRLRYLQQPFPDLPDVRGPFDLVVSNAALEHVADPSALFRRLAALLDAGGRMVHHVDAKTHTRGLRQYDPLNIYRYSSQAYRFLGFPGMPNRYLPQDYLRAAEAAGFAARIVPDEVAHGPYLEHCRPRLARQFRRRDDLGMLNFVLLAER